jgi:hypothetical protein
MLHIADYGGTRAIDHAASQPYVSKVELFVELRACPVCAAGQAMLNFAG